VKQILVIENAELWICLNREFAGREDLRISETATLESGIRLAKVESPQLVICSCSTSHPTPADLAAALTNADIDLACAIGVIDPKLAPGVMSDTRSKMPVCLPSQIVETVQKIVSPQVTPGSLVSVDLLAQCEFEMCQPGEPGKGFVNLLKVGPKSLHFESSGQVQVGDVISMIFVLPRAASLASGSRRAKIVVQSTVRSCLNPEKFCYVADITRIGQKNSEELEHFVRDRLPREEV